MFNRKCAEGVENFGGFCLKMVLICQKNRMQEEAVNIFLNLSFVVCQPLRRVEGGKVASKFRETGDKGNLQISEHCTLKIMQDLLITMVIKRDPVMTLILTHNLTSEYIDQGT